jgi:hypothetical protein
MNPPAAVVSDGLPADAVDLDDNPHLVHQVSITGRFPGIRNQRKQRRERPSRGPASVLALFALIAPPSTSSGFVLCTTP